ncbi:MAG: hypothetical protein PHO37_15625, partial [Kiritimatiellae bacterium]|nr:hypothetical protein [Kiritimatiellia bacterium]
MIREKVQNWSRISACHFLTELVPVTFLTELVPVTFLKLCGKIRKSCLYFTSRLIKLLKITKPEFYIIFYLTKSHLLPRNAGCRAVKLK